MKILTSTHREAQQGLKEVWERERKAPKIRWNGEMGKIKIVEISLKGSVSP
jgi:hypothetical protein